jgi:hypothetical protein
MASLEYPSITQLTQLVSRDRYKSILNSQLQGFQFQVVFDNFFTTTRLFNELRS